MKQLRKHPHLLEVNARVWLSRLSAHEGRTVTLSTVPQADLDVIAEGFDLVWLMGVWQRSPAARDRALATPENLAAYDAALPGWTPADVDRSPYAVYSDQGINWIHCWAGPPNCALFVTSSTTSACGLSSGRRWPSHTNAPKPLRWSR